MKLKMCVGALLGATALVVVGSIQPAVAAEKPGSLHVQCDGYPDNVSSGETAARLVGAVTLLGLFAPPLENADTSKRKFGAEGVEACNALIETARETNAPRRIRLILARALHRIEAKDYQAAIEDAKLARREAESAGLMADAYYVQSQARAFSNIEAAALLRLGRGAEAQNVSLRGAGAAYGSIWAMVTSPLYSFAAPSPSEPELQHLRQLSKVYPALAELEAGRLEEWGRFAEAADLREAYLDFDDHLFDNRRDSTILAQAAVANAIAGNTQLGAKRAGEARANFEKRRAEGKPESDATNYVELMDFYSIVEAANSGNLGAARRLFSARSQWLVPSFGSVAELNRRLRVGAQVDDLVGALAKDTDQLWKDRQETSVARLLAEDSNNKRLFGLVPASHTTGAYDSWSRLVWNTEKSRILIKTKPDAKNDAKYELLYMAGGTGYSFDAYFLHAALLAKSRGQKGFVFTPFATERLSAGIVRTGNPGEPGFPPALFNDADQVISRWSQLIPSPDVLRERKSKR